MKLWPQNAGWRKVFQWIRKPINRMRAQARRNEELTEEQKTMLRSEADSLEAEATTLHDRGRGAEDVEDSELAVTRDESEVTDYLCDEAQGETWNVLGFRKNVLATAGTSRGSIMNANLSTIKNVGRVKTVKYARDTSRELGNLPEFPERNDLIEKLDRRATAHEETASSLDGIQQRLETEFRSQIGAQTNRLRVDMVKLYGRLLNKFPRDFVESLFS